MIGLRPSVAQKVAVGAAPRSERPRARANPPQSHETAPVSSKGCPETETVSHIPSQQTETIPPCPCDVHDTSGAMPTVPTLAPECHVRAITHRFPVEGGCVGVKSIWLAKKVNALHPG
jgi:hypothetical protein